MLDNNAWERCASALVSAVMSVAIGPGATALDLTLSLANSNAKDRVNPFIADFDAAYAAALWCQTRPIWLETKTIEPPAPAREC